MLSMWADLPSQVENHLAILHEVIHRRLLPDIGALTRTRSEIAVNVEQVAAVVRNQRVYEEDVRAGVTSWRARLLPMNPSPR